MPLFGSSRPAAEPARVDDAPTRKGSIFSSRRHASPDPVPTNNTRANTRANRHSVDNASPRGSRGGFFNRRRNSSHSSLSDNSSRRAARNHDATAVNGGRAGFFGNKMKDATLDSARGKVHAAELAEREAVSRIPILHSIQLES